MTAVNWDTISADKCRLPELLPDVCEKCRDFAYCHRQITFDDLEQKDKNDAERS